MAKKSPKTVFEPVLISSREGMRSVVTTLVADKLAAAEIRIEIEQLKVEIERRYQARLDDINRRILMNEGGLQVWSSQNPGEFDGKKSIDLPSARFGFRTCPPKVEKGKGVKTWDEVVARLISTLTTVDGSDNSPFTFVGEDFVRYPAPVVDKDKLLAIRDEIPAAALKAAGLVFEQDEIFYFEPKSEVLDAFTAEAA